MKILLTAALLGATAISSSAMAQTPMPNQPRSQASIADCDKLIALLVQRHPTNAGVTVEQVRVYKTENNVKGCHDVLAKVDPASMNQAAEGGNASSIVVQQSAPTVRVEQASPQVTVQQARPDVTVNQAMPEITVHQPAPTVTVDIPQPVITVRMPKPDVNVAMGQPQVQVSQPKPEVQFVQPSQPQVQVKAAEAQVNVQRTGNGTPNVTVEGGGQAQVHYEREQPKVVVTQQQGQPTIKVEQMDGKPASAATAQPNAAMNDKTALAGNASPATQQITVARINNLDLYNARGNNLGDVERTVLSQDNKPHIVIGHGGFLGLGEKRVAVPLDRVELKGDRLVIQGLSDDQIRAMPTWDARSKTYREMTGSQSVPIAVMK